MNFNYHKDDKAYEQSFFVKFALSTVSNLEVNSPHKTPRGCHVPCFPSRFNLGGLKRLKMCLIQYLKKISSLFGGKESKGRSREGFKGNLGEAPE